jgi:hypothetical protein
MRQQNLVVIHPALAAVAAGFALMVLGAAWSPRDGQGRPLLLLPELRAVRAYQETAKSWHEELRLLDADLAGLLVGDPADVLAQSRQAQEAMGQAVQIGRAIDMREAPPALAGLGEALRQASLAYLEAARAVVGAVNVPDDAHEQQAQEALATARHSLGGLEKNPWLTMRP